jgi:hypothetical protein
MKIGIKNIAILYLLSFLLLSSCVDKEQNDGKVDVKFVLKYNNQPLEMLKDYEYPDGKSVMFNKFSFFISNLSFVGANGETTSEGVKMVNFTNVNSTQSGALLGTTVRLEGLKTGEYQSFNICLGVPPAENAKTPADFGTTSDLSFTGEYWPGWKSYIFSKTEGFIDIDGDGNKEQGFALHTGSDEAFKCLNANHSITIGKDAQPLEIEIDLVKLFGDAPYYDIKSNPQIHSLSQKPQVLALSENLAKCFIIRN